MQTKTEKLKNETSEELAKLEHDLKLLLKARKSMPKSAHGLREILVEFDKLIDNISNQIDELKK